MTSGIFRGLIAITCFLMACAESSKNSTQATDSELSTTFSGDSISMRFEKGKLVNGAEFSYFLPDSATSVYLVFFDPQGKGSFPVQRFQGLAEKYKINLVGSNRSKNGMSFEQTRPLANVLVSKILNDFPGTTKQIYFVGFSGGAKAAIDAGMANSNVKAVVYAGAPWKAEVVTKPILGFAGTGDMNYVDLLEFDKSISTQIPHFLVEWRGKHTWPDSASFEEALVWIAGKEHLKSFDFQEYIKRKKQLLSTSKDEIAKVNTLASINFIANESNNKNPLKTDLEKVLKSGSYQKAIEEKKANLAKELQLKAAYSQAFMDKDLNWWKLEIENRNQPASSETKALNERLLGYFSLAAYSYSNQALAGNQLDVAGKLLEIYRLADPKNPEQAYLRAVLAAKTNQTDQILSCLNEAVELGFEGRQRILEQPEFQSFQSQAGFMELVGRLKN